LVSLQPDLGATLVTEAWVGLEAQQTEVTVELAATVVMAVLQEMVELAVRPTEVIVLGYLTVVMAV
jgi:hypothetical protein